MGTRDLEFEPHEWHFDASKDDLAAIDVTSAIGHADDLAMGVPDSDFVTVEWMKNVLLTNGRRCFMVGLFQRQSWDNIQPGRRALWKHQPVS